MHIMLVVSSLCAGGAERVISNMANDRAGKGWQVTLLTHSTDTDFYSLDPRVQRIDLGLHSRGGFLETSVCLTRIVTRVRRNLRGERPNAVISFVHRTNILTLISAIGIGVPVIISERNDPVESGLERPWAVLRKLTYRSCAGLVMQTSNLRAWAERLVSPQKVSIIPNPVLPPNPVPNGDGEVAQGDKTILAVARLLPQKGIDLLLRAFARCERSGWELIIAGDGRDRKSLESLAEDLRIADSVTFAGLVKCPLDLMRRSEIFVLSSRHEGFPNALCEAMARGLPAISFDCPSGPAEIIRDGLDGIVVPHMDIEALSRAMSRLMSDGSERRRMGARAVEVADRFGPERVMGKWEELLQAITQ